VTSTGADPAAEPVRWGFLGAGTISTVALGPAVAAADGATLQAVAARSVDRSRALAQAHGARTAYGSYTELLADDDVQAVYIGLHNGGHRPWALAALAAGKHVLCEKPLGLTAAEVEEMAAAAAGADRLLVEASWYRWHPRVRLAQRLASTGEIGPVRHVSAGFAFAGVAPQSYRLDPANGGGALYDVGCYAVSAVLWAFGQLPIEVAAQLRLGPTGVDVASDVILGFEHGDAEVHAGIAEPERQWLRITGAGGQLDLPGSPYASWLADSVLEISDGSGTRRVSVPGVDPYRLMVEEMSRVICGQPGWVLPVAESRQTAVVLDATFASGRLGGQPVSLG
jgi:D-xylose 1-dehydrogenase (NADP+, D-xylono-1,5-lactone-forming)